jgi:Proline-rich nuclear receptor coactivator motif
MYIDPAKTNMDQEVNAATAKLKGLLGIGGGGEPTVPHQSADPAAAAAHAHNDGDGVGGGGGGKPPNPNKNKRNRKNKSRQPGEQGEGPPSKPAQQHQQNRAKSPQDRPPRDGSKKEGGVKNDVAGKKGKNKKNNKKNPPKGNDSINDYSDSAPAVKTDNFAWSAFQSSPDASKLPIPAFSSPAIIKEQVSVSDEAAERHAEQTLASLLPVPAMSAVQTSTGSEIDARPDVQAMAKESRTGNEKSSAEEVDETLPPPSKTGINLAALTSASSSGKTEHAPTPGLGAPSIPTHQPHLQQQQQQQHLLHSPLMHPMQHMNYQYHPGHNPYQHHHMPYHQSPPGYVTIQVQVPPVLMPNRQMVVSSPAGYPVQVVVPEGIPPGMWIPVHVPAAPPMHMMSPEQQQQQAYQLQQQRYHHHQPGR